MIDNVVIDIVRHLLKEIVIEISPDQKEQLKAMGVDWKTKCAQVKLRELTNKLADLCGMKLVSKFSK